MVEVGECFLVQFDGRRGRCTQNVLKGKDLVFIVRGQTGLLLLEDGQGKNIAVKKTKKNKRTDKQVGGNHSVCGKIIVNIIKANKHI